MFKRARTVTSFVAATLTASGSLLLAPAVAHADDLDAYARAVDEHPTDAKANEAYATAAIAARRYDDAIGHLKVGIARIPGWNRGYYLLAFAYRSKSAWSDAADFYRVCISVKQQETDSYFGLGKALAGLGDNAGAATAFQAYVDREKDPAKTRFVDAARAEIGKLQAAGSGGAGVGSGVASATGNEAATLKAEADSLKNQGRFDEAVAAYKKAIAVDGNNQDLHNDLGNTYFALKRYGDAAAAFKDAVARDGNFAIGWYNLANALRKGDRRAEAVDAYRNYIRLQPSDPDPRFGLGQTLKGMGDLPGAAVEFKKYLEMEKRPEQQKWIDKARAELETIEGPGHSAAPGGKVGFDDK